MTRGTFRRIYMSAKIAVVLTMVCAVILLGDFIVEGGWPMVVFAIALIPMSLIAFLVFTRCDHCRRSLGWISGHSSLENQPNPETLDTCPHCSEPFFKQSNLEK